MPYIGRDLNRGNYLKLDDISSSFNGSTQTFNLTVGGSAFTPGSAFSILVSVGGVIQEPESAYQVNNSEITFANAPTAQDSFFCLALGVPIGIGVPGNGTVNGTQMAKPFNYDGYFYLDDANNRVGIGSLTPTVALDVIGNTKKLIDVRSKLDKDVDILVAPELYISGYPIDDLVLREDFLDLVEKELNNLAKITTDNKSAIIVGAPRKDGGSIKNSVFVMEKGEIISIKDKYELPNTGVFDEQRIFEKGPLENCVKIKGVNVGLPICEDIWKETVLKKLSQLMATKVSRLGLCYLDPKLMVELL